MLNNRPFGDPLGIEGGPDTAQLQNPKTLSKEVIESGRMTS